MQASTIAPPADHLARTGHTFHNLLHYQQGPEQLVRASLARGEGQISDTGALVINTGAFTGRSPKDKFIVRDALTTATIDWNDFNHPLSAEQFDFIYNTTISYLEQLPELWVRDCFACADPRYRIRLNVICATPAMSLFAHNMFIRPSESQLRHFVSDWTVLSAPDLQLDPVMAGTRQGNAAVISFTKKTIILAGTGYTGEMKKAVFSVLNYLLPHYKDVLSMHCAANCGAGGDTALFFGLSGTGKTTLSADPERELIGDDEHGWSADNVFNFEGGCYAKTIDLREDREPAIFHAVRAGALVENTLFSPGGNRIDFSNRTITENTRASYPLHYIPNARRSSTGQIPCNIFFLTCDAAGVLPPISRLTAAQAMYQFISGYTAKIAGTEAGVCEPVSTFSACFGAPFLPLHPGTYAAMLGEKMKVHHVKVWLVNTGWTGGGYGIGSRIKLFYTRAMIAAALRGQLDNMAFEKDKLFGMDVPLSCPGVPASILWPRNTWTDPHAYDNEAQKLARKFVQNFQKYEQGVSAEIVAAGPAI